MEASRRMLLGWTATTVLAGLARPGRVLAQGGSGPPAGYRSRILSAPADRWTGDLDGMIERRLIRVLVPVNRTFYFLDGGRERGLNADLFREFEKQINQEHGKVRIHVLFKAVARDQLIQGLLSGRGDVAAGNLTITPEREALVAFAPPVLEDVREVLVLGPEAPEIASLDDLAGRTLLVRRSSSYWASATALSTRLEGEGRAPLDLDEAPEELEDEDLLEMVAAGILPFAVVDDHKARFWGEILPKLRLREDLTLRSGGQVAWAYRKNSPLLAARLARFAVASREGTLLGNTLLKRYLAVNAKTKAATGSEQRLQFDALLPLFKLYGPRYGFDPLMLAAQGFQESGLDPSRRSRVGAIGVMQVMPATAADKRVAIREIARSERNIEAAAKYMRILQKDYFSDLEKDQFNRTLFSFAAYNAGPARLARLRKVAAREGLDQKIWFDNVETVVSREVGREPVDYVRNIFKYYVAYRMLERQMAAREAAREKLMLEEQPARAAP